MNKIGVGIIGAGFLADVFARCYREMSDVELTSVSSRRVEDAKLFAERHGVRSWYGDYEKMLKRDDVDAVNICTPNYLHASTTISALENGKHVLCTKPLAITMAEAEEMVRTADKSGTVLMYGENLIFTPAANRIKKMIDEGALGKILAIEGREQHSGSHSPYATKKRFCGGGVLIHMAVHPIGFIMHLFNQPVTSVYAEIDNLLHTIEVEDYVVLLMRFEDGGRGLAQSNYITKGGMQERVEIYGTEGMAFMNLTHMNPISVYSNTGYSYVVEKASMSRGWTSPVIDEKTQYGFKNMLYHFTRCIREEKKPISTGAFGKDVLNVIFTGYESSNKKKNIIMS